MNQTPVYQWVKGISQLWAGFTRHFKTNMVYFTRSIVLARSSQVWQIAGYAGGNATSQRRRLQRFVSREIDLRHFCTQWTQSVVHALGLPRYVLVVDETKLRARFGVMMVGLATRGRCIPLAWRSYGANAAAAYPAEGQVQMILDLLAAVQAGLPPDADVLVLADRGIGTSPDLMRGVIQMGWRLLFRVTKQSKLVLPSGASVCFAAQVTAPGTTYQASGLVFKQRGRIPAHVRVVWDAHAQEPWALVTNDPTLTGREYAQRMWIEETFRDFKSYGWHVDRVQLRHPQRLDRLWMLLAVAYTWMLLWGETLKHTRQAGPHKRLPDGTLLRQWSLFRIGCQALCSFLLHPT